jgi:hypothetical protein
MLFLWIFWRIVIITAFQSVPTTAKLNGHILTSNDQRYTRIHRADNGNVGGEFPRLPFEARRIVEMHGFPERAHGAALHIFQNSMVMRLKTGDLIASYDDFQRAVSYIVISFNEGKSWFTLKEHGGITSLNLFHSPNDNEYNVVYALGHSQHGAYVNGSSNNVSLFRYDFKHFYTLMKGHSTPQEANETKFWGSHRSNLPDLKTDHSILNGEYNFLTSNTGVEIIHGKVVKQFDIIPSDGHVNHIRNIIQAEGVMTMHKGEVKVTLDMASGADTTSRVPTDIAARFSVGMKIRVPFCSMEGYVTQVIVEENVLVISVDANNVKESTTVNVTKLFANSVPSQRKVMAMQDRNNWWVTILWAAADADLIDPLNWHLSNIRCGYANQHAELFNQALDMGLPVGESPYPVQIYPHAEEGFVVQKPDGNVSVLFRFSNRRLCDMALEVPLLMNHTVGKSTFAVWLDDPSFTTLPAFGRAHPALRYDPQSNGYWLIGNVGRALHQLSSLPGVAFRDSIKCIWERNAVGLYFSRNLKDWSQLGVVDFENDAWFQLSYPCIFVDGNHLLVTMRTTTYHTGESQSSGYNNHNANAIYMYKLENVKNLLKL